MIQNLKDYIFPTIEIKKKGKVKRYVKVVDRIKFLSLKQDAPYQIFTNVHYLPELKGWMAKAELSISGMVFNGNAFVPQVEDFAERKAETAAVGRACAFAGIGVIDEIASAEEMEEMKNLEPITDETIENINNLIEEREISHNDRKRLINQMYDFTEQKGRNVIGWLLHQPKTADAIRDLGGNATQKEVNKSIKNAVERDNT